ncbi:DUF4062 domain-containing protein [Modestobacter sp. NPDC049651]|uniref:ATP-binding protein n=1 Tax=unclassified Modestobacter TaxID=2643866 RepID=UPI0033F67915
MAGRAPTVGDRVPDRPIGTPDRRLRVFVSSTLEELAAERAAVRAAVTALRLTPVMFELGARPHPPRDLYRAYLEQSDVFVGVYGDRYGWIAEDMAVSGLEDEFDLSAGKPRLLYVRTPAPGREPRLAELVERMQRTGGASTTPYRDAAQLAELVADDLAVLLTERFTGSAPADRGLAPGRLPAAPGPLVGRRAELATLTDLLRRPEVRLVTLTGPGGIGKTRLALAAAGALGPERDGVWFVDLAELRDAARVPEALAAALGVRTEGRRPPLDAVADRLGDRRSLLVLDNAEQVRGSATALAALLARCPGLTLLVTSRSVLGLRGEQDLPLQPLATPAPGEATAAAVTGTPAGQLFEARARQADPSFAVGPADAAAVAELVRRLDGLPLAIELAAARVRTLPPAALLRRLGTALDLGGAAVDAPDRQRTLRATIAWSHALLGPDEQLLFARLSVCKGCTLGTAEELGAVDGDVDVLEALSGLVAQSLVSPSDAGEEEPRFRMLGVVREFAAEQLRARGEEDAARERLAAHLVRLSADAGAGLGGPQQRLWQARLAAEAEDLQATLDWAAAGDRAELVVRLAAPLYRWWWARGQLVAMAELADRTAGLPSAARLPPRDAASLLWARGSTRIALGRTAEAAPLLAELVEDARALGDPWLLGHGLAASAMTRPPGDPDVRALLEEAVAGFRSCGDLWAVAYATVPLGDVLLLGGDAAAAADRHAEGLRLARQVGDDHLSALLLDQLAYDALLTGDVPGAAARLAEAAALHRALRDLEGLATCLGGFAGVAFARGDAPRAARLAGAAQAARDQLGVGVWPLLRPLIDQFDALVAGALPAERVAAERAAGAAADPWAVLDAELGDGPAG